MMVSRSFVIVCIRNSSKRSMYCSAGETEAVSHPLRGHGSDKYSIDLIASLL